MVAMKLTVLLFVIVALGQNDAHKKKTKLYKKSIQHLVKAQALKTGKAAKRQDMVFNDETPADNDGPVGQASEAAGVDGLGGDMHGYPTGMGAGAEPLGAFENEDTAPMGANDAPQSLDDKSDSVAGEARPFSENSDNEDDEESEHDSYVSNEPMKMKELPKAKAVSMSNSVNDLDGSVNVQGDGDLGKYVRNSQREKNGEDASKEMIGMDSNDPPFTGQADSHTEEQLTEGADFMERDDGDIDDRQSMESDMADKRRLVKHKSKSHGKSHHRTWKKPFKVLQR